MKSWVLRFRKTDEDNFLEIKSGSKKVETRAATEKYRRIRKGDRLRIVCGRKSLTKKVSGVRIFRTVDSMFKIVNYKKIMPFVDSASEAKKIIFSYPSYREKLKRFGIAAFYLR